MIALLIHTRTTITWLAGVTTDDLRTDMLTVDSSLETKTLRISTGAGGAVVGSKCTDVGALGLDGMNLVYCNASNEWASLQ